MARISIPCKICEGPLHPIGYKQTVEEDPNQNYKRIPDIFYCPNDDKFFIIKTEDVKIGHS